MLKPHLLCAAYEAPLTAEDGDVFNADISVEASNLEKDGFLNRAEGRWHLSQDIGYPAQDVNIRATSGAFYTLVEKDSRVILETVEEWTAFTQLHPGAIYLHQGTPFLVSDLDVESQTAYDTETDVPYYTEVSDYTVTRILNTYKQKNAGNTTVYLGKWMYRPRWWGSEGETSSRGRCWGWST